jgi:hypothetical protein
VSDGQEHSFLRELFGEKPGRSLFLQLWTKADKRTHYFTTADKAAEFAVEHPRDVYVAVSLASKKYGNHRRAPAAESAGIAGVWADIDINGGPENKTGAAPDVDAAEELAFSILTPTLVVNSGYGLQAWWLFEDGPWYLRSDEDREQAARVAAGWIQLIRQRAEKMGFGIDATQDLARLLRIPGSVNCKGGLEAPVAHHFEDDWEGQRHSLQSIVELTRDAAPATAVRAALDGLVGEFDVRPEAEPSYSKMNAALTNSPNFRKTWEHTRRDRAADDWSLSEWDLSLASQAAFLDWTDQEIADLIIAHRRKYNDVDKALRPDYLRATIAKARRERRTKEAESEVDTHLENLAAMAQDEAPEPAAVMAEFNGVINSPRLKVRELIQDGEDHKNVRYRLIVDPGSREVPIGPASILFNPDAFREAFGVATGHVVMPVKRAEWLAALQALLNVRTVNVAADDTPEGVVIEWLSRYLGERMLRDQTEAARRREPFEKEGHIYVFASSFATFVNRSLGRRIGEADLKQMLKAAGFSTKTISFHTEAGKATSRSYYSAPREVVE